jgi:hypothetical protein
MVRKALLLSITVAALLFIAAVFVHARAQVLASGPERVRFQMLSNEPIATPDGGAVVAGSSASVVRDRRTGQCYVAVTMGSAMGLDRVDCGG